ncbi:NUDIX hydrolase [Radiobacillus deserti]|uniref:NUDIX hydrolase n=1 Tax=Radiobacillus deserti TaxID=2594883 RepID=A0A516KDB1_9BACI|nr:NUDIX hydrolase [Radiobacillus deserti]QDP39389.1 NUDIX hydrolase [Radiobacillus deserti]
MKKWKTLKSEYVHQSPFGNIRKDQCELPNGIVISEYYVNEYSDWVNAVVLTEENQLVLVEQFRYAGGDFFLEVPAGKREEGETHEEGLVREVQEETGYASKTAPIFLGEFMVNPATQNNKVKTYLLIDAYQVSDQNLDDTEEINVKLVDFDQFGSLIRTNQVQTQLFTSHAYYMAKDYLLQNQEKSHG